MSCYGTDKYNRTLKRLLCHSIWLFYFKMVRLPKSIQCIVIWYFVFQKLWFQHTWPLLALEIRSQEVLAAVLEPVIFLVKECEQEEYQEYILPALRYAIIKFNKKPPCEENYFITSKHSILLVLRFYLYIFFQACVCQPKKHSIQHCVARQFASPDA